MASKNRWVRIELPEDTPPEVYNDFVNQLWLEVFRLPVADPNKVSAVYHDDQVTGAELNARWDDYGKRARWRK